MKYEKDLEYLRRELKNAQNIYDEAEENERESDAEMWMNRITHLEFQIDVFKNAAKAGEYEAKAVAFDRIKAYSDKAINGDIHSLVLAEGIIDVVEQYDINRLSESGESDV